MGPTFEETEVVDTFTGDVPCVTIYRGQDFERWGDTVFRCHSFLLERSCPPDLDP